MHQVFLFVLGVLFYGLGFVFCVFFFRCFVFGYSGTIRSEFIMPNFKPVRLFFIFDKMSYSASIDMQIGFKFSFVSCRNFLGSTGASWGGVLDKLNHGRSSLSHFVLPNLSSSTVKFF